MAIDKVALEAQINCLYDILADVQGERRECIVGVIRTLEALLAEEE